MSQSKGTNVVGLGFIVNIFMLSILPWNRIIKDTWRGWKNGPLSYKKKLYSNNLKFYTQTNDSAYNMMIIRQILHIVI
jgi:hypothetical protein